MNELVRRDKRVIGGVGVGGVGMVPRLDVVVLISRTRAGEPGVVRAGCTNHAWGISAGPGELSVLVVKTTPVGDGAFEGPQLI